MLVIHNGNELNVTNDFTLGQLLKYGAVPVVEKAEVVSEEQPKAKPKTNQSYKK